MTNFVRPLPSRAGRRGIAPRHGLVASVLATLAFVLLAAPAGAVVTKVGSVTAGVAPRASTAYTSSRKPGKYANAQGNPVLHGANTYVIYWDPTDHYHGDWQRIIDNYMHDAGTTSGSLETVFSTLAQYTDKTNRPAAYQQTYMGSYTDTKPYPASGCKDPETWETEDLVGPEVAGKHTEVCLSNEQVATELERFIAANKLPKGMTPVYYVLTPPAVAVCLDGGGATGHCSDYVKSNEESYNNSFCSYHAAINPGEPATGSASTVLYGVIPWSAGGWAYAGLHGLDQGRPGMECQDSGLNPTGAHGYELEKEKVRDTKEQHEFEEKNEEEKNVIEEAKLLQGPHPQEPNQEATCPNVHNGGCETGLADLITNQISIEQDNIVTDPLLNAWQDTNHNENADECRFLFGSVRGGTVTANPLSEAGTLYDQEMAQGTYYLNDTFNLADRLLPYPGTECQNHVNLAPAFNSPNTVNSGELVGFDGMESDIDLDANTVFTSLGAPTSNYATYTWNFGDGSGPVTGYAPGAPACENPWLSPCAASVFHAYTYGGTYTVTLTVTDVGGDVASTTRNVTVVGPAAPSATPSTSGSGSASAAASGSAAPASTGPASTGGAAIRLPAPEAADAVLSRSLRAAARKGIVVRYSVSEQVAGHFEILLPLSVARRLGIRGPAASGLPAGTPAQVVIGRTVIVTTAGGRSSTSIQLSKRTSQRLSRLHKVSLMLRMIVHNAARTPVSTTVLSTFTLGR